MIAITREFDSDEEKVAFAQTLKDLLSLDENEVKFIDTYGTLSPIPWNEPVDDNGIV